LQSGGAICKTSWALRYARFPKKRKSNPEKQNPIPKIKKKSAGKSRPQIGNATLTIELIDHPPRPADACAIQSIVIASAHRQEFGLLRNRPDASLLLRARWIAQTRRRFGAANQRRI